jgi:hypothetical protein
VLCNYFGFWQHRAGSNIREHTRMVDLSVVYVRWAIGLQLPCPNVQTFHRLLQAIGSRFGEK